MTTKNDIREWLEAALPEHTHMIVATDTFDYEDFPVYCTGDSDCRTAMKRYQNSDNMSKVTEVYDLSMDKEEQLNEYRAWNL